MIACRGMGELVIILNLLSQAGTEADLMAALLLKFGLPEGY